MSVSQGGAGCSATGSIEGGTEVVVSGYNFGNETQLFIGGQPLVIDSFKQAETAGDFDQIFAHTVPNYAGPAAVKVISSTELEDIVIGGFTYVDLLQISYVNPAVVSVKQVGENSVVSIFGLGFNPDITLRAWKSSNAGDVFEYTVDGDSLSLYSAEKMEWTVSQFGDDYRGFVDLEVQDAAGRRYVLQKALFYGHLAVSHTLITQGIFSKSYISSEQVSIANGTLGSYIPDAAKLPPGEIVDLEIDTDLGWVYVLGRGLLGKNVESPDHVLNLETIKTYYAPSWISLVSYSRNDITHAAPRHGLGYYNLPSDLMATAMVLGDEYLYVGAEGYEFPYVNTYYDGRAALLIYDREIRNQETSVELLETNRNSVAVLPLPISTAPEFVVKADDLLFIGAGEEGVVVVNIANPLQPMVVRRLRNATVDGSTVDLNVQDLAIIDNELHIAAKYRLPRESIDSFARIVIDISRPSLPQRGTTDIAGLTAVFNGTKEFATGNGLTVVDAENPLYIREIEQYQGNGFTVPGVSSGIASLATTTVNLTRRVVRQVPTCGQDYAPQSGFGGNASGFDHEAYLTLYDRSVGSEVQLLDGLKLKDECLKDDGLASPDNRDPIIYSDDGLIVFAVHRRPDDVQDWFESRLMFVDTLLQDLAKSIPEQGENAALLGKNIELYFTQPVMMDDAELSQYISLIQVLDLQTLAYSIVKDEQNARHITLVPVNSLVAQGEYEVRFTGDASSRRTVGLFDYALHFKMANEAGESVHITSVSPQVLPTTGGEIVVVAESTDLSPEFYIAGLNAPLIDAVPVGESIEYRLSAPANVAGPASLQVIASNGTEDTRIGAINYVEPLIVTQLYPTNGSLYGGDRITIKGKGFRTNAGEISVHFGGTPVLSNDITVIDSETIEVVSPGGVIGVVDVRIAIIGAGEKTLGAAFEYLQPIQSNIRGEGGRIYDAVLDPTGNFLITASANKGVVIYNVNASNFTTSSETPQDLDSLRELVDLDGDGKDDRILTTIKLETIDSSTPDVYQAIGVDTYFEHGLDRVFVTGIKTVNGEPVGDARLFVISFDAYDISNSEIIDDLILPSSFAKSVDIENNRAIVALGNEGFAIVDTYLHTKQYLVDQFQLFGQETILDVLQLQITGNSPSRYIAVGGDYDIDNNTLTAIEKSGSGGFYIVENSPNQGQRLLSQLDVPATRVEVDGDYAYLAAGAAGLVIVDISNLSDPRIVSRVSGIGHVFDIAINGQIVYLAMGDSGIYSIDITNPVKPVRSLGMESYAGNNLQVVVAGFSSAIGAGQDLLAQTSVLQVSPDVVLYVSSVEPSNGILDKNIDGTASISVRFNKAIDHYPENISKLHINGPAGGVLQSDIIITNNDVKFSLNHDVLETLVSGDKITVLIDEGIASVKPDNNSSVLYELAQSSEFEFVYSDEHTNPIQIDAVVPRRIPTDQASLVTIGVVGAPQDINNITVSVAGVDAEVISAQQSEIDQRIAIIQVSVPGISYPGQYDVSVKVLHGSTWNSASLLGGIVVDSPIRFDTLSPFWGDINGGTEVMITGEGFEPGNTVIDGLKVRVGSLPVAEIEVYSTTSMKIVTPRGAVGKHDITGENRFGETTVLGGDNGFGYGLKQIGSAKASLVNPTELWIDEQTGVAITSAGYFVQDHERVNAGYDVPETMRAGVFSIQDSSQPVFVGGSTALPQGANGKVLLQNKVFAVALAQRTHPTEEEKLRALQYKSQSRFAIGLDSAAIHPSLDWEEGGFRKRLYVASGRGGVARLNLDEQNGLQFINEIVLGTLVTDVIKSDNMVFAASATPSVPPNLFVPCTSATGLLQDNATEVSSISYFDPFDPVEIEHEMGISGSVISLSDDWLYAAGKQQTRHWVNEDDCIMWPSETLSSLRGNKHIQDSVEIRNIVTDQYLDTVNIDAEILDMAHYGKYLLIAAGSEGVTIIDKTDVDNRSQLIIDNSIQSGGGLASKLSIMGSTLFVSTRLGVVVYDISDIEQPKIISAGNREIFSAISIYKDRLVSASSSMGLLTFDLPASIVIDASVDELGFVTANNEIDPLTIRFNELMSIASLAENGAIALESFDENTGVWSNTAFTVEYHSDEEYNDMTQSITVVFDRVQSTRLRVSILNGNNGRGSGLWNHFVREFTIASDISSIKPTIQRVENAAVIISEAQTLTIHGDGFRDSGVNVFIDNQLISHLHMDSNSLEVTGSEINALGLKPGTYNVRVEDGEFNDTYFGAIMAVDPIDDTVGFVISPDTATIEGGILAGINASHSVFMPGSKVVLRSKNSDYFIHTGKSTFDEEVETTIDLHDDVTSLRRIEFILPAVLTADIYEVYLRIPNAPEDVFLTEFSYTLADGLSISLPNYPPMQIGASIQQEDLLYVGVKGSDTRSGNSIQAGLEIYDISIWDHPIRLSQLELSAPVNGLALVDDLLLVANDVSGLQVFSVLDISHPFLLDQIVIPGHSVTDIDIDLTNQVIAVAATKPDGTGLVRFLDLASDTFSSLSTYPDILFVDDSGEPDALYGQPTDLQWYQGKLYVLYQHQESAKLVVFDSFGNTPVYTVSPINGANGGSLNAASLQVMQGQIVITSESEILFFNLNSGVLELVYWGDLDQASAELSANGGGTMVAGGEGIVNVKNGSLLINDISPTFKSTVAAGESIVITLNNLIDIETAPFAIELKDTTSGLLDISQYTIEATNNLSGSAITIHLSEGLTYQGDMTLAISPSITALDGRKLTAGTSGVFHVVANVRPIVDTVKRVIEEGITEPFYFHGDGTETAIIEGNNFGNDTNAIEIWIGDTLVSSQDVVEVTNNQIKINMPNLQFGVSSAALPVEVKLTASELSHILYGAVVILPQVSIEDIIPRTGPPQGGNHVDIYGSGFSLKDTVKFAGAKAAGLQVLSSNHIRVRVPAGSFGPADVTVESELFPGDESISQTDYFYAGTEAGSIELANDKASPVAAMVMGEQILYLVTGGNFDVINSNGVITKRLNSNVARLVAVDVVDPVNPQILQKEFLDELKPYHFDVTSGLDPDGFVDAVIDSNNLYLLGGNKLYHFDITLATDPLLLNTVTLEGNSKSLAVNNNVAYVSTENSIEIYRLFENSVLQLIDAIPQISLNGRPGKVKVLKDELWVAIPDQHRLLVFKISDGSSLLINEIDIKNIAGLPLAVEDFIKRDGLLIVSTGETATVQAMGLTGGGAYQAIADIKLSALTRAGNVFASQIELVGQSLYVVSGEEDVQVFDISSWMSGTYDPITALKNYYSLTGKVTSLEVTGNALYAGTSFALDGDVALENPIDSPVDYIGGGFNTILFSDLTVLGSYPGSNGYISTQGEISVQLNRILDQDQLDDFGSSIYKVKFSGVEVEGIVSQQVNNVGSKLIFRPVLALLSGAEYQVELLADVKDLHGNTLGEDYRFKFFATDASPIQLDDVEPRIGSWKGGDLVTLYGTGFNPDTAIYMGGIRVNTDAIYSVSDTELTFMSPGLISADDGNRVVTIAVENDELKALQNAAFTYVANPEIEAIGTYDSVTNTLNALVQTFVYNGGEYIGVKGEGIGQQTRVRVNGTSINDIDVQNDGLISFQLPNNTLGTLHIELSNGDFSLDTDTSDALSVMLEANVQLQNIDQVSRDNSLMATSSGAELRLWSLFDGAVPQLISVFDAGGEVAEISMDNGYLAVLVGSRSDVVIFDISNIYDPVFVNRINNAHEFSLGNLTLSGQLLIAHNDLTVYYANIRSKVLTSSTLVDSAQQALLIDAQVQKQFWYGLFEDRIEIRAIGDFDNVLAEVLHDLVGPSRLDIDGHLLTVTTSNGLALVDGIGILNGLVEHVVTTLDVEQFDGNLVLNGELLVRTSDNNLILSDVSPGLSQFTYSDIARIASPSALENIQWSRFAGDLFEWVEDGRYFNAVIPLTNVAAVTPIEVVESNQSLVLTILGDMESWQQPDVTVINVTDGSVVAGVSELVFNEIHFSPSGSGFSIDDSYNVSVKQPSANISGANILVDMPRKIKTAALFGFSELSVTDVQPSTLVAGVETTITLSGTQLDSVNEIRIGNNIFAADEFTLEGDSLSLNLSATISDLGLHGLSVTNGEYSVNLPGVVSVQPPFEYLDRWNR